MNHPSENCLLNRVFLNMEWYLTCNIILFHMSAKHVVSCFMHSWTLCTHMSRLLDVVWSMLLLLQRLFSHLMWSLLIQRKQSPLVGEGYFQLLISCEHLIWCQLLISCKHLIWCENQVFIFTNMLHISQAYMITWDENPYWISKSALFFFCLYLIEDLEQRYGNILISSFSRLIFAGIAL